METKNSVRIVHNNPKPALKITQTRIRKITLTVFVGIILAIITAIACISPLSKYLIEKYSEEYTGRKITLDWAYINPLTGNVYLKNVKISEAKKDTVFFRANSISIDFALLKAFSKTYEISSITIDHPWGIVSQHKKTFNFDDLILRFAADSSLKTKEPLHFNILSIKIEHGNFIYKENVIPIYYRIRDLSLESSGKRWNVDTIETRFSFLSQNGKGTMKGNFVMDVQKKNYRLITSIQNFDLEITRQYLWELINYGMFSAQLDAALQVDGNFSKPDSINVKGRFSVRDFYLGKTIAEKYVACDTMLVVIEQLNPSKKIYLFDSIILTHPFFKYEKFDSLNNIEMILGKNGSNISDVTSQNDRFNLIIEMARYIKKLSRNFFKSPYKINTLQLTQGNLQYSDYSLSGKFNINATPITIRADSISKHNKRIRIKVTSGINPYGYLAATLQVYPKDSGNFDITYHLNHLSLTAFNPYLISYTSFPLNKGVIEFNGQWTVRDGNIKSTNHLLVIDPRISSRLKNENSHWLPLPLIMAFVRERGDVIDYKIPITGNLKDPHFHLHDVVTDLIENIFIKPATLGYSMDVKTTQSEIENSHSIQWNMRQHRLQPEQKKFMHDVAKFLKDNKGSKINIHPIQYALKEKECILFFEAKKKYFLLIHKRKASEFNEDDSIHVERMSIKEKSFMRFLKRGLSDTVMFTIQEKCAHFIGNRIVERKFQYLKKIREEEFRSIFKENGSEDQVIIHPNKNSIPFNGFSYYKITYPKDVPEYLQKAYKKMDAYNDESPRKRYFKINNR